MACAQKQKTGPDIADRLLSRRDLRHLFPVSDMTIWRWEQAKIFPGHITIGGRNFWREAEVRSFIEQHAAARATGGEHD